MQANGTNQNQGLVQPTLPLQVTEDGRQEYAQFDWWDDRYLSVSRVDETLDWSTDFFPVDEGKSGDPFHFAVHWTATMEVSEDGSYSFATASDDESWVFIDGQLVVDNGGLHGRRRREGETTLTAGEYDVDIFFAERHRGGSNFSFYPPSGVSFTPRSSNSIRDRISTKEGLIDTIRADAATTLPETDVKLDTNAEELLGDIEQVLAEDDNSPQ